MSKRYRADEPDVTEEVPMVTEAVEEETPQVEMPEPVVEKKAPSVSDREAFIARKLKVINEWPDGAKKRAAAERVLRN